MRTSDCVTVANACESLDQSKVPWVLLRYICEAAFRDVADATQKRGGKERGSRKCKKDRGNKHEWEENLRVSSSKASSSITQLLWEKRKWLHGPRVLL